MYSAVLLAVFPSMATQLDSLGYAADFIPQRPGSLIIVQFADWT
jgi:hypothetical protein